MEQKRRPLRKKRRSPLIQFLPYIIIVVIAAVLIVAVVVVTDKQEGGRQESQHVQTDAAGGESLGIVDEGENPMQILSAANETDENGNVIQGQTADGLDTNHQILNLIQTYFQAEKDGDADTLNSIMEAAAPITQEQLDLTNEIITDYQNIVCYIINGLDSRSWVTYISYDIEFINVEQTAPSLDRFIVRQNDDGTLYIDMTPADEDLSTYLEEVRGRSDVRQLYTDVNNRYIQACNSSQELTNLVQMLNEGSLEMYESESGESQQAESETNPAETGGEEITSQETAETAEESGTLQQNEEE